MGFAEKHLLPGERIVFRTRLHWIVFVGPLLLMASAVFVAVIADGAEIAVRTSVALGLTGLLHLGAMWLSRTCSEFVVTDKRVLMKTGFLFRRADELLLAKVESIEVRQSVLGRVLRYGSIVVGGTGGSRDPFKSIAQALGFRRHIQEAIEAQRSPASVSV